MSDIANWLAGLGLAKYAQTFVDNEVDLEVLGHLSEADLQSLGLPLGPRKKVLAAIAALPSVKPAVTSPPPNRAREAERRQLTVLFVDLAGSTALSSRLDPEEMREVLRAFQSTATSEIEKLGGHVAKLMGDGLLAYFGWPEAHEDDPERAVNAGLALVGAIARLSEPVGHALACRVGIATGPVVVGDLIGEAAAQEAAVVGETPNLAARLQAAARPGEVVVSAATRRLLGGSVELQDMGELDLKGLPPQRAFRAIALSSVESRFAARDAALVALVGREEELALLRRLWGQAREGDGQAALLLGEAGLGKSRLVQGLAELVEQDGGASALYQCSPLHSSTPLWPMRRRHEALIDLPADQSTPEARRALVLQALVDALLTGARAKPLLVLFEDAHWIDPTTLELLRRLLTTLEGSRLLLMVTSRPENTPALAAPLLTRLSLSRLGRVQANQLLSEVVARHALPAAVRQEILARSDGVPLFIEELTKAVLEAGPRQIPVVPASLQDSLIARLDRTPAMKAVAQIAACLGRDFDHQLLTSISDLPPAELAGGLDALISSEIVFPRGSELYSFKHALMRDIAYQSLLRPRRQHLHQRIARALEATAAAVETPELLARHCTAAGEISRAVDYWLAAGKRAAERSANLEAAEHFAQGLELLKQHPQADNAEARRLSLLIAQGPALMATIGWSADEVRRAYAEAGELAAATGRAGDLFPALWGRWLAAHAGGQPALSLSLMEQIFELLPRTDDPQFVLQAHHAGASNWMTEGSPDKVFGHVAAVEAMYQPELHHRQALMFGGHDPAVCVRCIGALARLMQGGVARAEETSRSVLSFAETVDHAPSVAHAHYYRAELSHIMGDVGETERCARKVLEIAVPRGMAHYIAWSTLALGWTLATQGKQSEALRHTTEGIAALRAVKNYYHLPHRLAQHAETLVLIGRYREASQAFEETYASVSQSGEKWYEAEVLRRWGEFLVRTGGEDAARIETMFERALDIADQQGALLWKLRAATALAEHWTRRDQGDKARQFMLPVLAAFADEPATADILRARKVSQA